METHKHVQSCLCTLHSNPSPPQSSPFRANYITVWEALTAKVMAHADRARLLSAVSDMLISLSSLSTPCIRHAVTEAGLAMGRVLLKNSVDVQKKIGDLDRQALTLGGGTGHKLKAVQTMLKDSHKVHVCFSLFCYF